MAAIYDIAGGVGTVVVIFTVSGGSIETGPINTCFTCGTGIFIVASGACLRRNRYAAEEVFTGGGEAGGGFTSGIFRAEDTATLTDITTVFGAVGTITTS